MGDIDQAVIDQLQNRERFRAESRVGQEFVVTSDANRSKMLVKVCCDDSANSTIICGNDRINFREILCIKGGKDSNLCIEVLGDSGQIAMEAPNQETFEFWVRGLTEVLREVNVDFPRSGRVLGVDSFVPFKHKPPKRRDSTEGDINLR